ncbi:hypothetical protein Zmor_006428 [Zophobas morio]|uniref:GAG-pre-integrase domain-containing protein n=1 Tax=Zophobas morio TaxID=2755281 RepID=A0AA38I6H8_9CUCU|nr:hypothetical protein Zmor_021881 [Zophobas morio]KAJ3662063.1 hypothetical protein Zmor_006428 [Zophobas morio]
METGSIIKGVGKGDILMKQILHVPELKCNLFSVTSITDKGYSFELNREECRIFKGGEVFALGKRANQLYQLLFQVENSEKNESQVYLSTYPNKKEKLKVWHERLSHQNVGHVRSILNQLKIPIIDDIDFFCQDCMLGKLHVLPIKLSSSRADQPGKIIYANLGSPVEEQSLGGAFYFLMLKDDYSHYPGNMMSSFSRE